MVGIATVVAEANDDKGHLEAKQCVHGIYVAEMGQDDVVEMQGDDAALEMEEGEIGSDGVRRGVGGGREKGMRRQQSMKMQELEGEGGVYELGTGRRSVVQGSMKGEKVFGIS